MGSSKGSNFISSYRPDPDHNIRPEDARKLAEIIDHVTAAFSDVLKNKDLVNYLDKNYPNFEYALGNENELKPTPANIVFGDDEPTTIIFQRDFDTYEEILKKGIELSPKLQSLKLQVEQGNDIIRKTFENTRRLHRGTDLDYLESSLHNDLKVGYYPHMPYGKKDNFVPASVSFNMASSFGMKPDGINIQYHIPESLFHKCGHVTYEVRGRVKVFDGERYYSPFEEFNGKHSGKIIKEAEVHLPKDARPKIETIVGYFNPNGVHGERLKELTEKLSEKQKSPINVIYLKRTSTGMVKSNSDQEAVDRLFEKVKGEYPSKAEFKRQTDHVMSNLNISRNEAIDRIRHWR